MNRITRGIARSMGGLVICAWVCASGQANAQVARKAAQEAAEAVMQKFGRQVVKEGTVSLATRIESSAAKYGEEVLMAVRKVGPEALTVMEGAGTNGAKAAGLLARYGEEGATLVVRRPTAMAQVIKFGDEAAAALVKHPGIAEPLVERGGASAVRALEAVSQRNGRRVAMLMEGELGAAGTSGALLDVIGKYGDRAAEFVWNNKAALAVGATLTAFVANPEPFLNGAEHLTRAAGESITKPIAEGIATGTNWTLVVLAVLAFAAVVIAVKFGLLRSPDAKTVCSGN